MSTIQGGHRNQAKGIGVSASSDASGNLIIPLCSPAHTAVGLAGRQGLRISHRACNKDPCSSRLNLESLQGPKPLFGASYLRGGKTARRFQPNGRHRPGGHASHPRRFEAAQLQHLYHCFFASGDLGRELPPLPPPPPANPKHGEAYVSMACASTC